VGRPDHHQRRRDHRQGGRARDPYENLGAQLAKEVATKTNDVAGDGTTTATVLAQALVHEGLRNVAAGANPIGLKRGIDKAVEAVVDRCWPNARPVEGRRDRQVATISAQDAEIGELIADAFDKVGKDGVITVEESNTFGTELEFTEGMQFDKGYLSPYFVTDAERMEAVLEDPYILLVNRARSRSMNDLLPLLEKVIGGQAAAHHRRGRRRRGAVDARRQQDPRHLQLVAVKAPASAIAARRCSRTSRSSPAARSSPRRSGLKLDQVGLDVLGRARRGRHQGQHDHRRRRRRAEPTSPAASSRSSAEIERTDSDWDREKLQERLAKLAGGVCVIKVGAATEVELKEKKHRIEDAVSATRARHRGGHRRRWRLRPRACRLRASTGWVRPVTRRRGAASSQGRSSSRCAGSPRTPASRATSWSPRSASCRAGHGLNAATGEYEDLIKAGVIDPVKVTRSALRTPPRSRRCCSPPRRSWWTSYREESTRWPPSN
jgi:chaperonin GroEL